MNINFRQIILVLSGQLRAALMSKRVLIGYLIGVMAALKAAYLYGEYASNHPIQIFEPWLMNFRSLADITIMLVGFILVVADAPFVDSRSLLTIYRTSRGNWYDGLCLYVLVQGIIYFALSLTASCIYTIPHGYIQNQWSVAMKQLVLWPSDKAIITWHLVAPGIYRCAYTWWFWCGCQCSHTGRLRENRPFLCKGRHHILALLYLDGYRRADRLVH